VVVQIKINFDDNIAKHKAILVAHAFTQQYGIEFHENFSAVAKITTLRLLLSFVTFNINILLNNVFHHGNLTEEILY